jgi:hypothetical protein
MAGDSDVNIVLQPVDAVWPRYTGQSHYRSHSGGVCIRRNCPSEQLRTPIPSGTLSEIWCRGQPPLGRCSSLWWFRLEGAVTLCAKSRHNEPDATRSLRWRLGFRVMAACLKRD